MWFFLENVCDENGTKKNDCSVNDEEFPVPLEQTQDAIEPVLPDSASKTARTPIHLLKYISDVDTPSPNSRQITPMPKTTIFVSPPDCSENPALADSVAMTSPEEFVRPFPARTESEGLGTPSVKLASLNLESPENDEKRRDSVFFAPKSSFSESLVKENLMCFSPVVERDDDDEGICFWTSIFLQRKHLYCMKMKQLILEKSMLAQLVENRTIVPGGREFHSGRTNTQGL